MYSITLSWKIVSKISCKLANIRHFNGTIASSHFMLFLLIFLQPFAKEMQKQALTTKNAQNGGNTNVYKCLTLKG